MPKRARRRKSQKKIEYSNVVEGTLDEKGIKQRITYFFNKLNKPDDDQGNKKRISSRKSKPRQVTTDETEKIAGTRVVLGNRDAPSVEEIKKDSKNTSIRIGAKQLNQLAPSDVGGFLQLSAPIKTVTETKNGFEILVSQGEKKQRY